MAFEYRDPEPLARAAILWTWIWLAVQALYGAASAYALSVMVTLPSDTPLTWETSPPELANSDLGLAFSGLAMLIAFLVSGFLILKWIHRTNSNAHSYSSEMSVSPGWNVGFFFIPIANLWKPFEGVRETWEVSNMHNREVPGWMRWWWGLWLTTNFIDNASFRIGLESETIEGVMWAACLDIVSAIVAVPLALLLIRLIRSLTAAQVSMNQGETFA